MAGIDKALLEELTAFLQVFKVASIELEATKSPTLHLVLPWYHTLKQHCETDSSDSAELITLKTKAISLLTSKFAIDPRHSAAAVLNPKMRGLKMLSDVQ